MIGSGLKKLAGEYGMKVDRGVAYGSLRGYAATMCEGSGYKQITFSTTFSDPVQKTVFLDAMNAVDMRKTYRVMNVAVANNGLQFTFQDTVGTMGKIREFLAFLLPLMQQYQASTYDICLQCGQPVTDGKWMLKNGVASYLHAECARQAVLTTENGNARRKYEDTGSYVTGTIGAFLGALVGAVVWAVVLLGGYVASLVGLLIGWLSDKGYNLLRGRKGKGKVAILILAIIFGVVAGTVGADVIALVQMIGAGELEGAAVGDIPLILWLTFLYDGEYRAAALGNMGLGLLFAALGVYYIVIRAGKEVAGDKIVELK